MSETVTVLSRARVVCESCSIADTMWTRLRGLMGRRELEPGEGLLLRPSGSVHTCFMRFAIDIAFLDSELRVLAVSPGVRPWRLRLQRGARAVLELPAGEADRVGIAPGDQLTVECSATNDEKENAHVLA
jgi:uncharacterized membrane protein (UPF0127 family)